MSTGLERIASSTSARGRRWTRRRRAVQIGVALFYLLLPVAHLAGFHAVLGNLGSIGVGPVDLIEPASGVSTVVASGRLTWNLVLGMAPVVLLAVVLGPVFCAWVCPWGLLSELLDRWLRGGRKRPLSTLVSSPSGWLRPLVLVGLMAISFLTMSPVAATLSAPRLLTQLPIEVLYLRVVSPVTLTLLLILVAVEILAPRRLWCRKLCPVGSVANYVRSRRGLRIRFDDAKCLCPTVAQCEQTCPWALDPRRMKTHDGCTHCMACIDVCPSGSLQVGWVAK